MSLTPAREWSAVVLAAGKLDTDLAAVLNCFSPLMLPFSGRPNVYWLLAELERLAIKHVYLVVNELDDRAERFVTAHFSDRVAFTFVKVPFDVSKGPGNSLVECLDRHGDQMRGHGLLVINGDISFKLENLNEAREPVTIWTTALIDSDKYTFVAADRTGRVEITTAKPEASRKVESKNVAAMQREHFSVATEAGVYAVRDAAALIERVPHVPGESYRSVVSLLTRAFPDQLFVAPLAEWSDVSHLDSLLGTADKSVAPRAFNRVSVDDDGVLRKRSTNLEKLRSEINYYQTLPKDLQIHFPRLVDASVERGEYALEYYPFKTLSQYLVFQGLSLPIWQRALKKLVALSSSFRRYDRPNEPAALFNFYWTKTISRFESAARTPELKALLEADAVTLNGRRLAGFNRRRGEIERDLRRLCEIERLTLVHGDLCFSNILFDPGSTLVRLIDPRGEFIDRSHFGDYRYDLAKLLHSVHGRYDFILHGLCGLKIDADLNVELQVIEDEQIRLIQAELFRLVKDAVGDQFRNVVLLEALLFISMIPLHAEDRQRQRAFYLTGLKILSEIYDENLY